MACVINKIVSEKNINNYIEKFYLKNNIDNDKKLNVSK